MKRRPPPRKNRGQENPPSLEIAAATTGQQESKSVTQIREVESQIAETTQKMQALTVEVASLAKEVQPHFRLIENSFKEADKEDPDHPLNSKIRRKLLSAGAD